MAPRTRPNPPRSYQARLDVTTVAATKPRDYPQPFDSTTLAFALGIEHSTLWFLIHRAYELYTRTEIPKKSGGKRVLHVPDPRLAYVQRQVLRTFLDNFAWPEHVAAYVPGRSVLDAAEKHVKPAALVVLDIKDFFPSVKRWQVRDAFQELFGLSQDISELLATLTTAPSEPGRNHRWRVPQGAPTSGAVANLVAVHRLDPAVLRVCRSYGMTYTRYADDLAFSRKKPLDRKEAKQFIHDIAQAIYRAGFRVNWEKVRVRRPHRQQRLLGLVLNEGVNIPKKSRRRVRACLHQCTRDGMEAVALRNGFQGAGQLELHLQGVLAYFAGVRPDHADALRARLPALERPGALVAAAE